MDKARDFAIFVACIVLISLSCVVSGIVLADVNSMKNSLIHMDYGPKSCSN
jgi:hypothetical protein